MSIGTRLHTWLHGELVGSDRFGNRYYRGRRDPSRRWVLFAGEAEASLIPPEWHGWLHHTVDEPPGEAPSLPWQKEHVPNLTGTGGAYRPAGAVDGGFRRPATTGDYEPWRPE